MKKAFDNVGILLVILIGVSLIGVAKRPNEPRTISISGDCLTSAPKDRTAITLRVTTVDKNPATSMKMATKKMAEITDFLKTQDVKMQTTEFSSYEKSEWNHTAQKSVNLGTETRISVEVSSNSMDKIENILNKFAGNEYVYTDNLRMFTSSETMKPIMEKCLGTALENARARANALVAPDKKHAGKLLSVSYGNVSYNERPYANYRLMSAKAVGVESMDTGGSFVSKDTEVTVSVSAMFEIK